MALVYRHRRLDTNEIFYIGIGKDMKRPFDKVGRNIFWKKVTNKTKYEVEILIDNIDYEEAKELEILLIKEYGRRDLGLGTLVNLTDGGEGLLGFKPSQETKNKISNSLKGNIISEETRKKISEKGKGRTGPWIGRKYSEEEKKDITLKSPKRMEILNTETGEIIPSIRQAAKILDVDYACLRKKLIGKLNNNTPYIINNN